ncbi:MAG: AbrB/MazE/SpoVT family DNA-binding domain-containing protein [Nitrososphaeria archaeon]
MIIHTKIDGGKLVLPKELLDKYGINMTSIIMLIPMDDGIFIKPITRDTTQLDKAKREHRSMETEVDDLIEVLSDAVLNTRQIRFESVH